MTILLQGNGEIDFDEFLSMMTNTEKIIESFGELVLFVNPFGTNWIFYDNSCDAP